MGKFFRGPLIYIIIIVVIILAAQFLGNPQTTTVDELQYSEFLQKVQEDGIKDIAIQDRTLVGRYTDSKVPDEAFPAQQYDFSTTIPASIQQFNQDMAAVTGSTNPEDYGFAGTKLFRAAAALPDPDRAFAGVVGHYYAARAEWRGRHGQRDGVRQEQSAHDGRRRHQ